ncbi:PepSY-like domain-containing protein [Mesonia sp. MT50]|uniref:PepSY-like domain-containing protein n=1 Tax=Mesonia profundi TaxID=3070998 RepID=A0ABU1A1U9_9FLAO|nr:PepSY-like domain-containing protein [Mesonia profundi]MDQ7917675.1 PepSY-like domain-containing protein [Mesonia profundi]
MKILKMSLVFLFASVAVQAQDLRMSDVPANLTTAFNKEFANATDVEWEKDMENYKVEFEIDRMDYDVWYSSIGQEVKRKVEISSSQLPSAVSNVIKKNYADFSIDDVDMIKTGNKVIYEIDLETFTKELEITIDKNGKVLSERKD